MSYHVAVNRIEELRQALSLLVDSQRRGRVMQDKARTAANVMLTETMRRAPVGRLEPNYSVRAADGSLRTISHGFPSLRQHGIRLSQGWLEPTVVTNDKGVAFQILSRAPHIGVLLTGAPPHPIPQTGRKLMSFYHFNSKERFKAAITQLVQHPGFAAKTFVTDAAKVKRPFMLAKFRESIAAVLSPLRGFFE